MTLAIIKSFKQKELPSNYFRGVIRALRYLGIELERAEEPNWFTWYSKIGMLVWLYTYTCVECWEFYLSLHNIDAMLNILNFLITHVVGVIKITDIYVKRDRYRQIMAKIQTGIFAYDETVGDKKEEFIIRDVIKKTEFQVRNN